MGQQYVTPDEAKEIFAKGGWCANPNAVKGLDLFGQLRDAGVFVDNVAGYTGDQMTNAYFTGKAADDAVRLVGLHRRLGRERQGRSTTSRSWPASRSWRRALRQADRVPGPTRLLPVPQGRREASTRSQKFIEYMYSDDVLKGWVSEANQILDVKPDDRRPAPTSNAPLVIKGAALADTVDWLVLPDGYFPAGMDYQPAATEFLGRQGTTGADFCQALDAAVRGVIRRA